MISTLKNLLIWTILSTCLYHTSAFAQKINFGTNSSIIYQQNGGTFNVFKGKKLILKNGYSAAMVNDRLISTKDFKKFVYTKTRVSDAIGAGTIHVFSAKSTGGIMLIQKIHVYPKQEFFTIEVSVAGQKLKSNQMFPLNGELTGNNFEPYRHLFVPFDNDAFISYKANLLELNKQNVSAEVTSIYNNNARNGFVVGTLDHDKWKSAIKTKLLNQQNIKLITECGFSDFSITRDKIKHGYLTGNVLSSAKTLFGAFGDWRLGMEAYAKTVRKVEKPIVANWNAPTPVGWNSWGAMQEKISYQKAVEVVDFFANELKNFRVGETCYIDLDSYWDNMLNGNDYSTLKKFADYCKSKGLKPGIYWAPFTDWGFKGGPDRKAQGSNFTYGEMWTKVGDGYHDFDGARALDPTHPGTQSRIKFMIDNFKKCGFEMIKIDFLGHAAAESTSFFDENITTGMQAYKVGMEYLLKCLDNKMLVYAAISPNLASGKYVQARRIACDAFKSIKDTEYTLNSVTNGWWQTYLYNYIDADHVVLGNESEEANIARTLSAIVTGTLIVGDDFSVNGQWKQRAAKHFQNSDLLEIIKDGKAFQPVEGDRGKGASQQYLKAVGRTRYLAVFNFDNQSSSARIDYNRLGFSKSDVESIEDLISHQIVNFQNFNQKVLKAEEATILKIILKPTHKP